ncbi:hypothetical protein VTN00DRAFT_5838 [Thermoascus crustaceus]|uniref:uncharacterized protein n=1 Tax=Thermoascus crustaceus TaxID=5088 RepID=UPI003741FC3B
MHLGKVGLLAFGAVAVEAFRDTSPFFFASTSEISTSSSGIKTATSLLDDVASKLSACPTDYYVIASQPGVHATDFSTRKSAPRLRERVLGRDAAIRSNFTVAEVAGVLDSKYIQDTLKKKCSVETTDIDASTGSYPSSFGEGPRVINVDFPMLPLESERAERLVDNDGFLSDIIERLPSQSYTLLYVTSPREYPNDGVYNSEQDIVYQDPVHMELKRDYAAHTRRDDSTDNRSVFEKYQFFTPGLFMCFIASFICLAIFYVGLSALTSLQVPYAAFERDTAPGSQKKQQ